MEYFAILVLDCLLDKTGNFKMSPWDLGNIMDSCTPIITNNFIITLVINHLKDSTWAESFYMLR